MERLLILLFVLLSATESYAQADRNYYTDVIPPSPNASAIGKYIESPVSLYTGKVSIDIPLYQLNVGDISVPISLSYHTGGIKVEEIASWVGLGWTLNAGGIVSRSAVGRPDEGPSGLFAMMGDFKVPPHIMTYKDFQRYYYYYTGDIDSQHDIFYYTYPGASGKFVLDAANGGKPLLVPQQKIDIKVDDVDYNSWIITAANGIRYTFNNIEYMNSRSVCTDGNFSNSGIFKSSWYLSKIESSTTKDFIEFEYLQETLNYETLNSETKYESIGFGGYIQDARCKNYIVDATSLKLIKITSSNGVIIEFTSAGERVDLRGNSFLSEVIIKENRATPLKKYILNYKYLEGSKLRDVSDPFLAGNTPDIRLMLTSIKEVGYNKILSKYDEAVPPYQVEYYIDKGLPSRLSYAQDLWGYYNGANNTTMVPAMLWGTKYLAGASKKPSFHYAKQGSIKKMKYPSGGSTTYEYEFNQAENFVYTYASKQDSGLVSASYSIEKSTVQNEVLFEIENPVQAEIEYAVSEYDNCVNGGCKIDLWLLEYPKDGSGPNSLFDSRQYSGKAAARINVSLNSSSTYKLIRIVHDASYVSRLDNYFLSVTWYTQDWNHDIYRNRVAGGLRIKKTATYDPVSADTLIKEYGYKGGYLSVNPIYTFPTSRYIGCMDTFLYDFLVRASSSSLPLASTNGGIVGYAEVKVSEGVGDAVGYTIHKYVTVEEHPDYLIIPAIWQAGGTIGLGAEEQHREDTWKYPYPQLDNKDWKRGLLKSKTIYNSNGNKISSKHLSYKFYDERDKPYYDVKEVLGVKVGSAGIRFCNGEPDGSLVISFYKIQSSRYELVGDIDSTFHDNGSFLMSSQFSYEYGNPEHLQLTKKAFFDSKNDLITTSYIYPADLNSGAPSEMWNEDNVDYKHIHDQIIEETTTVSKAGADNAIYKKRNEFKYQNGLVLKDVIKVAPSGTVLEAKLKFNKYNDKGKILEIHELASAGIIRNRLSYIWGYSQTLPITEAKSVAANQIYHTSFEETGIVHSSAKTGRKVGTDNLAVIPANLRPIAGTYILSYWERINNEWQYKQTQISYTPSDANLVTTGNLIDEVRLYPKDGQMTTFTYELLVGMTSSTDANNITTYYGYDNFGRLKFIKDDKGNIIKELEYKYATHKTNSNAAPSR